ncbi:Gibberellin 2-beta-dioxygenase [Alteripontixanthobacter maritimus]|uniref:2-oxoglutarate-dependent ethylene/succinate-forming enzyme n=1 Tax=Alteripontixanthobacter maritimus TaxID=2161824 RepID=A0A369QEB6_9SPHN|nr:2OG-Fe(II) oxygenase family protein [Alteripontixanthobacter maritimus]RDC60628.1 Gibberellin 2-beta-dioxygenase [Alteripontixanthobacter maritimus]
MTGADIRIATVSLERPLAELAATLGQGFAETGFAVVEDHAIDAGLIARAEQLAQDLFALSESEKMSGHRPGTGGARGYTPFGTEKAKDARVHDLKEFWHIGRELGANHPLAWGMPENVWPEQLPEFAATFRALYTAFEAAGARILAAIAIHLGLPQSWFEDPVRDGNSVLRVLHYPPLPDDLPAGAVRAAAHGDINTITLLLGAQEAGLELQTKDGEWLAVNPPAGALVVNIGDMLERLTNGRLRSTRHRVVNPGGAAARRSRYSMPFFLHFRPDFLIEALPQCVAPGDRLAKPITAHDFLAKRLREIGLV